MHNVCADGGYGVDEWVYLWTDRAEGHSTTRLPHRPNRTETCAGGEFSHIHRAYYDYDLLI